MARPGESCAGGPRRRDVRNAKFDAVKARGWRGEQVDGGSVLNAYILLGQVLGVLKAPRRRAKG